ncbi:transposable element Tc1 transposase [Trichonephila clavipes]|nr:transposable element Tc1 transposase [Trichonephila clavipes]
MALRFSSSDTMMEGPTQYQKKKFFFAGKSARTYCGYSELVVGLTGRGKLPELDAFDSGQIVGDDARVTQFPKSSDSYDFQGRPCQGYTIDGGQKISDQTNHKGQLAFTVCGRGGATIRNRVLYKPAQIRRFINVTIIRRLLEDFGKRYMPGKQSRRHFSQLSEFERGLIIGMKTAGWSTRHVAGQKDRSEWAVRNCWEQWTREGTHAQKTKSGATRKTTWREDRRIVRQALVDPTVTRSTIRAHVAVAIVPQTISKHLAEANLKSEWPFRALPLTPEHQQLRLQWCQARSMWNVKDWQKVVFSDESRFVWGTDDNRVRVWRQPGERYNSPHNVLRHTACTAAVMVWRVIAYDSRSTLIVMRGFLRGQRYVDDILRPHVGPFLNGLPGVFSSKIMLFRIQQELPKSSYVLFRRFHGQPAPPICPL